MDFLSLALSNLGEKQREIVRFFIRMPTKLSGRPSANLFQKNFLFIRILRVHFLSVGKQVPKQHQFRNPSESGDDLFICKFLKSSPQTYVTSDGPPSCFREKPFHNR